MGNKGSKLKKKDVKELEAATHCDGICDQMVCTRIAIVGGGPAGLVTAIVLAEGSGGLVHVTVFDSRWVVDDTSGLVVAAGDRNGCRRDQVVTLQEDVLQGLSEDVLRKLFENFKRDATHVWFNTSNNIPIREVEDRLLEHAQCDALCQLIDLRVSARGSVISFNEEADKCHVLSDEANFNVVIGADGGGSWVRRFIFGTGADDGQKEMKMREEGEDLALGIAFEMPNDEHGQPLPLPFPQSKNIVHTVAQSRYLLNANSFTGDRGELRASGYLNMRVSQQEWNTVLTNDGTPCGIRNRGFLRNGSCPTRTEGGDLHEGRLFQPYVLNSPLWQQIKDGFRLYGFAVGSDGDMEKYVSNIVGIRLNVRSSLDRYIQVPCTDNPDRSILAFLVGDAAMTTHFWPGRGMNSAIKAAIQLASSLRTVTQRVGRGAHARALVPARDFFCSEFTSFAGFMESLRIREHPGRSVRFLCGNNMDSVMGKVQEDVYANDANDTKATTEALLCDIMLQRLRTFQARAPRWHHDPLNEATFRADAKAMLEQMSNPSILTMHRLGPWPGAGGRAADEVLPGMWAWADPAAAAPAPAVPPSPPPAEQVLDGGMIGQEHQQNEEVLNIVYGV
jgi:2-polyprenyl-6-methoxyphenol hydroxylase-like FAD-dependent oxidoreductase